MLNTILAAPRRTLLAWLAVIVVALVGASQIQIDFSSSAFYASDAEPLRRLEAHNRQWRGSDEVLVVVASSPTADWATPAGRERLRALGSALEGSHAVENPVGVMSLADLPALDLAQLRETKAVPLLLSDDGRHAGLVVWLRQRTDDPRNAVAAMTEINEILAAHEDTIGASLGTAGIPATRAAFIELAIGDQLVLGPLAALLAGAVLLGTWRRPWLVAVAAIGAGVPVVLLVGLMGWMGEPIGLLNQAYFTLLPVIALADTVHLVARTRQRRRSHGEESLRASVRVAAKRVGWACLLTSLTTGLGFASLAYSSLPILRHFGLYAAGGIAAAYAAVVLLVPVLLTLRPIDGGPVPRWTLPQRTARWCASNPGTTLGFTLLLAGAAVIPARAVVIDNHLSHLLEDGHPVRTTSSLVDDKLGGTLSIEVDIARPGESFPSQPGYGFDAQLKDFEAAMPSEAVRSVMHPMVPGQSDWRIDQTETLANVSVGVKDVGGRAFAQLEDEVRRAANQAFPRAEVTLTGSASVAYAGVNRITAELRRSMLGLAVFITISIGLLFRRPGLALRSVIPNLLPLWLGYAAVGLSGIELDPVAAVVLALALGIAVDDTIHIMARFTEYEAEGMSRVEAAVAAVEHTGRAVVLTSICLALGLAVNLWSSFPPLALLGSLGAGVIVIAMLADLTVLPALLALGRTAHAPTTKPAPRRES